MDDLLDLRWGVQIEEDLSRRLQNVPGRRDRETARWWWEEGESGVCVCVWFVAKD